MDKYVTFRKSIFTCFRKSTLPVLSQSRLGSGFNNSSDCLHFTDSRIVKSTFIMISRKTMLNTLYFLKNIFNFAVGIPTVES